MTRTLLSAVRNLRALICKFSLQRCSGKSLKGPKGWVISECLALDLHNPSLCSLLPPLAPAVPLPTLSSPVKGEKNSHAHFQKQFFERQACCSLLTVLLGTIVSHFLPHWNAAAIFPGYSISWHHEDFECFIKP